MERKLQADNGRMLNVNEAQLSDKYALINLLLGSLYRYSFPLEIFVFLVVVYHERHHSCILDVTRMH